MYQGVMDCKKPPVCSHPRLRSIFAKKAPCPFAARSMQRHASPDLSDVTLVRQECERQKCERHQCEANSANANSAKGSTVRRDKSANVNSANASSAMRHRCEKSATAVRMTIVRKRHCRDMLYPRRQKPEFWDRQSHFSPLM